MRNASPLTEQHEGAEASARPASRAEVRELKQAAAPVLKVAVLGHYGQLNLGDEAITAAAIGEIRHVMADARVVGFSLNPEDTRDKHGVDAVAIRLQSYRTPMRPPKVSSAADGQAALHAAGGPVIRFVRRVPGLVPLYRACRAVVTTVVEVLREAAFLRRAWRSLEGVQLLMVAGSNQLLDQFGGAWGFPYTLLKWAVLARLRGARVVFLSVGAGPLDGWLSQRFVLWTLRLADYVTVRDPGSARLLQDIGWHAPTPVKPDLAFGLDPAGVLESARDAPARSGTRLHVALNLMPVHDPRYWPKADERIRRNYLEASRRLIEELTRRGCDVTLFGTQPADEWIAEEILEQLQPGNDGRAVRVDTKDGGLVQLVRLRRLEELTALYQRCDVVIATRFHGIVLAMRLATPVVGVCYYRKSRELLQDFGLERFAVDIESLDGSALIGTVAMLIEERLQVEEAMRAAVAARRQDLDEQYQLVLTPWRARRT